MENRSSILTINHFYSAFLDNRRDLFVYLPPGYHQNPMKRYPVTLVPKSEGDRGNGSASGSSGKQSHSGGSGNA